MELKNILNKYKILGVLSNYESNISENKLVKTILKDNYDKKLKLVGLSDNILNKKYKSLTLSEKFKVDLLTKINNKIIIIGGLSTSLNYKDRIFIKKLLLKISNNYDKKIIIIDDQAKELMDICRYFIVIKNKKIVYKTNDIYDENLYKYVSIPPIIEFVKSIQNKGIKMDNYTDTYELLKAIYRSI